MAKKTCISLRMFPVTLSEDSMKIFYFFGDSVTLGVNDAPFGGWVSRLAGKMISSGLATPPDTFYNLGVRKNSSLMIRQRWENEWRLRAIDGVPSLFLFCFGTVDMAAPHGQSNLSLEESAEQARQILTRAKNFGSPMLVSAPPVAGKEHSLRLETLCSAYASACESVHVPFLDIFHTLEKNGYGETLADGVHPGPSGNEMIASAIASSPLFSRWAGNEN